MTWVGPRYHVLDGDPKSSQNCKVMEHSTVSCAKTAELIDMPFRAKTQVSRRQPCIRWGCRSPKGKRQFSGGCPGHSKALAICGRCSIAAKGIIQSPITSCSRRITQYARQAHIVFWKFQGTGNTAKKEPGGVVGLHTTGEVWYPRLPCFISVPIFYVYLLGRLFTISF